MNKYGYPGIIQIYEPSDAIRLPKFNFHRENNWKDSANKSLFILDIFIKKYIIKRSYVMKHYMNIINNTFHMKLLCILHEKTESEIIFVTNYYIYVSK